MKPGLRYLGAVLVLGCGASTGGTTAAGGAAATGGHGAMGGAQAGGAGGAAGGGGNAAGHAGATGGAAGTTGAGGAAGTSGAAGAPGHCKRGIAANTAPGAAFSPAVSWWYDWSLQPSSGGAAGIEFVPMVWGASTVSGAVPAGAKFLLGFNEPNFMSQANLTPAQAAADWGALQVDAMKSALSIVGPAMNFCGPAASCNGTDPYQYLTTFFADCTGCEVDYVAAHWYNCDLASLQDYLEAGGSLPGYEQFDKPIWLTEFSCDTSASEAQQEAYMRAAIPYLESNPHVFRYAWFSADPIPNAQLLNSDGSPTALGQVYLSLPQSCP